MYIAVSALRIIVSGSALAQPIRPKTPTNGSSLPCSTRGVADYSDVAVDQDTLTADPLVTGVLPNLLFEGEPLILGGPTAATFHTTIDAVGTTFSLRT